MWGGCWQSHWWSHLRVLSPLLVVRQSRFKLPKSFLVSTFRDTAFFKNQSHNTSELDEGHITLKQLFLAEHSSYFGFNLAIILFSTTALWPKLQLCCQGSCVCWRQRAENYLSKHNTKSGITLAIQVICQIWCSLKEETHCHPEKLFRARRRFSR